jgi:hypothetical protein
MMESKKTKETMNTKTRTRAHRGFTHSILEMPEVEPWPEAVDAALLLDDLQLIFRRFVILPKWAAEALALWTLHTYAFQLRDVSTYLGLESPEKRCGKTTLLTVLSDLVNRPIVAANISSPALFRVIEEMRPTLLIDEADTFLQGNEELRGILNSGYSRKTAYVVRVASRFTEFNLPTPARLSATTDLGDNEAIAGAGGTRLVRFSCWCPKIMAAIGRLPETLADRCIVVRMQRKMATETCEPLRNLEAGPLRRQCARFVQDHAEEIAGAQPEAPPNMNDRACDIWEPLLALADLAGGAWPELARQAAEVLTAIAQEGSPISSLLLDILMQFVQTGDDRIFSRTLVAGLNDSPDRPWAGMQGGRPLSELWLSQQLRPYGIRPRSIRLGEFTGKGYVKEEFREVFRRYIPRVEVEALFPRTEKPVEKTEAVSTPK